MELASAFDAGAYAVELWLSQAPVDEDAPGNEPAHFRNAQKLAIALDALRDIRGAGSVAHTKAQAALDRIAALGPSLGEVHEQLTYTPVGYQGPAQHTHTTACDGFHEPGQCPRADRIEADGCECGSPTCRRGPAPVGADVDL
jgi:hypothetical protein